MKMVELIYSFGDITLNNCVTHRAWTSTHSIRTICIYKDWSLKAEKGIEVISVRFSSSKEYYEDYTD